MRAFEGRAAYECIGTHRNMCDRTDRKCARTIQQCTCYSNAGCAGMQRDSLSGERSRARISNKQSTSSSRLVPQHSFMYSAGTHPIGIANARGYYQHAHTQHIMLCGFIKLPSAVYCMCAFPCFCCGFQLGCGTLCSISRSARIDRADVERIGLLEIQLAVSVGSKRLENSIDGE